MPRKVSTEKTNKSWSTITINMPPHLKEELANLAYARGLTSVSQMFRQIAERQIILLDKDASTSNRLESLIESLRADIKELRHDIQEKRKD